MPGGWQLFQDWRMCVETALSRKRKSLVKIVMSTLLAIGFCSFVIGSRSGDRLATKNASQASEIVRVGTESDLTVIGEPVWQPDIRRETSERFASASTDT